MNRVFFDHGLEFYAGNYTPRKNDFEKGLKYQLFIRDFSPNRTSDYFPTGFKFSTIKEMKDYVKKNYFIWL